MPSVCLHFPSSIEYFEASGKGKLAFDYLKKQARIMPDKSAGVSGYGRAAKEYLGRGYDIEPYTGDESAAESRLEPDLTKCALFFGDEKISPDITLNVGDSLPTIHDGCELIPDLEALEFNGRMLWTNCSPEQLKQEMEEAKEIIAQIEHEEQFGRAIKL